MGILGVQTIAQLNRGREKPESDTDATAQLSAPYRRISGKHVKSEAPPPVLGVVK